MKYSEVKHFIHNHILKPESNETPYTCDGCKEPGWGLRFRCEECNYDLHKDCALGPNSLTHNFYGNRRFKLIKRGPADTCCSACGKLAHGLVYYDGTYSLHPQCAALPPVLPHEVVELRLQECVHTTKCCRCGKKNLLGQKMGWSYRSTCKNYHYHVSCVKDMVNDLVVEKWKREHFCTSMDIGSVPDLVLTCGSFSSSRRAKFKKRSLAVVAAVLNLIFSTVLGDLVGGTTLFFVSLLPL